MVMEWGVVEVDGVEVKGRGVLVAYWKGYCFDEGCLHRWSVQYDTSLFADYLLAGRGSHIAYGW